MAVSTFDEVLRIDDGSDQGTVLKQDGCDYNITVYPTKTFKDQRTSFMPVLMAVVVALVVVFTAFVFFVYDRMVERGQKLVMTSTVDPNAIVFPCSRTLFAIDLWEADTSEVILTWR